MACVYMLARTRLFYFKLKKKLRTIPLVKLQVGCTQYACVRSTCLATVYKVFFSKDHIDH